MVPDPNSAARAENPWATSNVRPCFQLEPLPQNANSGGEKAKPNLRGGGPGSGGTAVRPTFCRIEAVFVEPPAKWVITTLGPPA
ncbi:hypothetical protein MHYP_G00033370 [Metynnis hypsauchen]